MLPPTATRFPADSAILPTSVVTVVLALEPVIATTGAFASRKNSSISPITEMPCCMAC